MRQRHSRDAALYRKGKLIQISYSVRAVFTITWNRALMHQPGNRAERGSSHKFGLVPAIVARGA